MRKQVLEFGGSVRDLPPSLHLTLDTFYRRLILLVFHPARSRRAARERQKVIEAAIFRDKFRRLYL
ncbi:MAG TPA: hypothetical protein VKS78_07295 [Roseiarcus sp.]|nr:hypothetical protein [Roseiarcus sp.]